MGKGGGGDLGSCPRVGDLDEVSGFNLASHWPFTAIWGVNQQLQIFLSLCNSAFEINK